MKLNFRDLLALWEHAVSRLTAIFPTKEDLQEGVEQIMAKQSEAAATLNQAVGTLQKIQGETQTLLEKITALETASGNADVTPELQAAIDAVVNQANAVDALVPDTEPPVNS